MSGHTPGPWKIGQHLPITSIGWSVTIAEDGSAIAYVLGDKNPELRANARLIAAAPDLLEALDDALHQMKQVCPGCEQWIDWAQAEAAIARAKGESK